MAEVKPEIKVDPAHSPKAMADIDAFEDDTDLYIPPGGSSGAWLVKALPEMWKAWDDLYKNAPMDENIEIGKLRVYHLKDNEDASKQRVQISLTENIEQHKSIPKLYNLDLQATAYNNTVVFSEKDLPGHRAQPFGSRNFNTARPSGIQAKNERYGQRKPGSYRTAIPKQTALAPPVINEAVANPVEDDSSLQMFKKQYDTAMSGGKKVTYVAKIMKGNQHPGTGSNFTFGSYTSKPGKKKQPKEKAVRMPREQLLDRLQQCYQKYQYWGLKTLRNELKQPEAWIKDVIEDIAILMKSGPFTGTYRLTESTAKLLKLESAQLKEEAAPLKMESDGGTGDELGDGDDDEGEEFEDALASGS